MLRFFRNIRQKLLENGNLRKYFWYALGEILLVMIGILLALQVSNWNQNRIEHEQLQNYYERIIEEIESDIPVKQNFLEMNQLVIELNKRTLNLLSSGHPDSLNELKNTLGALSTAWSLKLSYPVLNEFKNNGYLTHVQNTQLKQKFFELYTAIEFTNAMDDYIKDQYLNTIEPFIIRSFNYQAVAMERYQAFLIPGGPSIDYTALAENLELWNTVTFKLETAELYSEYLSGLIDEQSSLIVLLKKELE
ncbi:MAG: hypothetical protein JJ966_05240 [Balneolaceae bacterium]|nr:hypothetical protein [Balneolaceae bacterium]